jgi:hypothetical protein
LYISLNIDSRRTCQATGGFIGFLNGKGTGNCLGVLFIGGFAVAESLVVLIGQSNRADFGTVTATGAFGGIDVPGLFGDEGLEIALRAFNFINFSACDQIDVEMPADLDQFGRNNSHGTVIGGKGFVQFTHHAADGG